MARIMAQGSREARCAMSEASKALQETVDHAHKTWTHEKNKHEIEDMTEYDSDVKYLFFHKASKLDNPTRTLTWNGVSRVALNDNFTNTVNDDYPRRNHHIDGGSGGKHLYSSELQDIYISDSDASAKQGQGGQADFIPNVTTKIQNTFLLPMHGNSKRSIGNAITDPDIRSCKSEHDRLPPMDWIDSGGKGTVDKHLGVAHSLQKDKSGEGNGHGIVSIQDDIFDVASDNPPTIGSTDHSSIAKQTPIKNDETSSIPSSPYDSDASSFEQDSFGNPSSSSPTTVDGSSSHRIKQGSELQPLPLTRVDKNHLAMIATVTSEKSMPEFQGYASRCFD